MDASEPNPPPVEGERASRTHPLPSRRRGLLLAAAAGFAALDLGVKAWAQAQLSSAPLSLGVLDLRITYNSGVAFSLAADAPAGLVLAVTAAITVGLLIAAWRHVPTLPAVAVTAVAAILGGGAANLIDRAPDGRVTDYLHTGWWPTFNLADTFIVLGGIAAVIAVARDPAQPRAGEPRS